MKTVLQQVLGTSIAVLALLSFAQPAQALIRTSHSIGYCMDAQGGRVRPDAEVKLWACHNQGNQQLWLDFGSNAPYKGDDEETYRNATIRFNDATHCLDTDHMVVATLASGRCRLIRARNVGANRFTIQSIHLNSRAPQYGQHSSCLQPASLEIRNGLEIRWARCMYLSVLQGLPNDQKIESFKEQILNFWSVEQ